MWHTIDEYRYSGHVDILSLYYVHIYWYLRYLLYTCIEFSILFTNKANVNIAKTPELT